MSKSFAPLELFDSLEAVSVLVCEPLLITQPQREREREKVIQSRLRKYGTEWKRQKCVNKNFVLFLSPKNSFKNNLNN